ncbi:MAG: GGDEF domain-containing protein [Defluviitaleaceae bacterium]|nr:GGDEF domain-containing protein [Defluviitaleaceae bacterium]MCL2835436.1 GGDEF domain-containing protein [Defluviitaleaceae bacterium]
MPDIFDREQGVLDDALNHISEIRGGAPVCAEMFETLAKEYRMLLKQHRKVIKISDRASSNMITDQKGQITDLSGKVHIDMLTGIFNRRYMEEALNSVVKTMQRAGGGLLSVLMMDVDYFKKYNDTYGHADGDVCLKAVAGAIKGSLTREDDFTARYGGEEFAVVLPNTDEDGACMIAERILENVRSRRILHEKSEAAPYVTVSIGIATGDVLNIQTGMEYIKFADDALYQSKGNGRNRYTVGRQ